MAVVTQIDIDMSGFNRYEYVVAKQGDDGSRYIQIRFLNNGKVYVLDNLMKARALITKPDKKEVLKDCAISGNYVELKLDNNILSVAGTANVEIVLTNIGTEDVLTSTELDLRIVVSKDKTRVESSDDYSSLKDGLLKLDKVATRQEVAAERMRIDEIEKTAATKQELDVERKRITNLATLQNGSTTGDAELADIRVGADGKIYGSAGESVRGQVTQMQETFEENNIFERTAEIRNLDMYKDMEWIDGIVIFGGNEVLNDSYSSTVYIPIESTAYYECNDGKGCQIYCYGEGYAKIGEMSVPAVTGEIALKEGTKYIRSYTPKKGYETKTNRLIIPTTVYVYEVKKDVTKDLVLDKEIKKLKEDSESFREQVEQVQKKVEGNDVFERVETLKNLNMYKDIEWIDGMMIFGGNEMQNAAYSSTVYIPIESTAYYECNDGKTCQIYCYGEGYAKIGEMRVPAVTGEIALKEGTKYIRSYTGLKSYETQKNRLIIPTTVSVYNVKKDVKKEIVLDKEVKKIIKEMDIPRIYNVSELYAIADSVEMYDTTGKYDYVYTGEDSKMQHAASIMNINGVAACVFNLNKTAVSDSSEEGADINVYYKGSLTNLKEATGVDVKGGRVVHGDKDYIICGGDYLVEYTGTGDEITWTARKFTNETELAINYMSQMIYKDGCFYSVPSTGAVASEFVMIKFDLQTMTISKVADVTIPVEFKSTFESCLYDFNGQIYLALRPQYKDCRGTNCVGRVLVGKLDSINEPVMSEYIFLPDGSTRPLFFTNKNKSKLFIMTGTNDRLKGWVFNITDLRDWYAVFSMKYNVNYADAWTVNDKIYWCGADIRNTVADCKVTFGEFKYEWLLGGLYN